MKRINPIVYGILSMLVFDSCYKEKINYDKIEITRSSIPHGTPSKLLYPLKIGNAWVYNVTTFPEYRKEPTIKQEVTGIRTINGDTFYAISNSGEAFYRSPNEYITFVANQDGQITTRFGYNTTQRDYQKIGTQQDETKTIHYYSWYGTTEYNGISCIRITSEQIPKDTSGEFFLVEKYIQPGVGPIAVVIKQFYNRVWNNSTVIEKWELKDYYLYP